MFSRVREWMAITRDICAGLADFVLCVFCVCAIVFLYGKGKENLVHAGMPPRTFDAVKMYASDPFLVERIISWGTVIACTLLVVVLAVSVVEGAWALLRRI